MTLDETLPKPLPLINFFGPWLFEACHLNGYGGVTHWHAPPFYCILTPSARSRPLSLIRSTHIRGKAAAIGALCSLVVRHHGDLPPIDLLSRFYEIIYLCLQDHSNSIVSYSILTKSNNIFNLALPACNILIPHYMNEIKKVVGCRCRKQLGVILVICMHFRAHTCGDTAQPSGQATSAQGRAHQEHPDRHVAPVLPQPPGFGPPAGSGALGSRCRRRS